MDYRQDELFIEKLIALTGEATYKEAFRLVKEGRITVAGEKARSGHLFSKDQVRAQIVRGKNPACHDQKIGGCRTYKKARCRQIIPMDQMLAALGIGLKHFG